SRQNLEDQRKECAMPYCITLRSRTDGRITGWYDGTSCRWSTDHKRQKVFEREQDAKAVCHELRRLCPRNAKVINIEAEQDNLFSQHAAARVPVWSSAHLPKQEWFLHFSVPRS